MASDAVEVPKEKGDTQQVPADDCSHYPAQSVPWQENFSVPAGAYLRARGLKSSGAPEETAVVPVSAIGFWKVALAVFTGNLMMAILAALIYAGLR